MIGQDLNVEAQNTGESVFFILYDKETLPKGNHQVKIGIYSNGKLIEEIESSFIGLSK